MRDVRPDNNEEVKLTTAIQKAVGAYPNGVIGTQSMVDIAINVKAECFPLSVLMYGFPVIVGKDIVAFNPRTSLKPFSYSMTGSFTYPRAITPCSILVNANKVVCGNSCHAHINKPESVIYRKDDGTFGIKRAIYAQQLPADVRWAVGGMGLLNAWNPEAEGFTGQYADVLRKTDHNVLGVKNNMVFGVLYKNMTAEEINKHCKEKMGFEMAILLDGGGLAAMNGSLAKTRANIGTRQGYAIQFI